MSQFDWNKAQRFQRELAALLFRYEDGGSPGELVFVLCEAAMAGVAVLRNPSADDLLCTFIKARWPKIFAEIQASHCAPSGEGGR
jgi:hypothetical protein